MPLPGIADDIRLRQGLLEPAHSFATDSRFAQVDPSQSLALGKLRDAGVGDPGASEAQFSKGLQSSQMYQPGVGHISLFQGQFAKLFESGEQLEVMIRARPRRCTLPASSTT